MKIYLILLLLINMSPSDAKVSNTLNDLIEIEVAESYPFAGLAVYLNQVAYFGDDGANVVKLNPELYESPPGEFVSIVVAGRYNAVLFGLEDKGFSIRNGKLQLAESDSHLSEPLVLTKNELAKQDKRYKVIRYHQLWWPLAQLSIFFEFMLSLFGQLSAGIWGLAILFFAVAMKVFLLPLSFLTEKVQHKVSKVQSTLMPQLDEIKKKYDGEEAHNKIMAAHKEHGVSPFFIMKPMLMTLVQIPFLIAVFNVLGEMPALKSAQFLWVPDLSLPDRFLSLGVDLPLFGGWLNILPFVMAGITLFATFSHGDNQMPEQVIRSQKIRLHFMTITFFVLFYPFPAAMVYYWALVNLLQLMIQKVILLKR